MAQTDILALILGGGAGSRLYPLTRLRAKPAVPIAGKYRLVDIPISNCLNSGVNQIYILTQFNSVSLHRHISQAYKFDLFSRGFVQILAAEQTPRSTDWYQGTADAIRKQLPEIRALNARDVLILSGDHLYRMDYSAFARAHREARADITVAVLPAPRADAPRFGILETDAEQRVISFHEKPSAPAQLDALATYTDPDRPYLGSMGIYLFRSEVLYELLDTNDGSDFGKHILPASIQRQRVMAYPFGGYWEDIGTIRSFYEANLALADPQPAFRLYDPDRPIYTHRPVLPTTSFEGECYLDRVLLADGCKVIRSQISESVIGLRSLIGPEARLTRTVIMGADFYETEAEQAWNAKKGIPNVGVGQGCSIDGAIIDKNARIGEDVVIRCIPDRPDTETEHYVARDGLVIVPKGSIVPKGVVI
ncbi:MAG TPA: glucose-1-phosphate adenylyltransferase [Anaerolineae bacterium]|nr:glucose-1-phosphate adenylyltransferase [Anaerolineae bacterium]